MDKTLLKPFISISLIVATAGIYMTTICPVVYSGDSGELVAAAFTLGIPHNSGYPLFGLLGKLFALIPIGNIAFRVNFMSAFFATMTVWLTYSLILRMTSSVLTGLFGALILAFSPLFWSQTVSAEVYPLHCFFIALLMRLLWWWDETHRFYILALFAFMTGLSFGNHMQTVMLAPAVFLVILTGDRRALLHFGRFAGLAALFLAALTLYLYLPIRTDAGAAIHWGDPNNWERFIAHVTAKTHRSGYVFNQEMIRYVERVKGALHLIYVQFGILLIPALWGLIKMPSHRWRVFCILIILFDFIYTVFLNTVSLVVTPFNLSTVITLSILVSVGIHYALNHLMDRRKIRAQVILLCRVLLLIAPISYCFLNYRLCDQSRNQTAYEHAVNIFRTVNAGGTLILDDDNNVFPVVYARLVEQMRPDVKLYDRHNILFKLPSSGVSRETYYGKWEELRAMLVKSIVKKESGRGLYFAVFNSFTVELPEAYQLKPYGILFRAVPKKESQPTPGIGQKIWDSYSTISFYEVFERDYMNREIQAFFYFKRGKAIFPVQPAIGLELCRAASRIGYDNPTIHSEVGIFYTDIGHYEEARRELEIATKYYKDLSGVYNNWGYYYQKIGNYEEAIRSFQKAIQLRDDRVLYHNNLALSLYKAGKIEAAIRAIEHSLKIKEDQPRWIKFMKEMKE